MMSVFVPMAFVIVEFSMNRIEIPPSYVISLLIVVLSYIVGTMMGQELLSQPIYPDILDWKFEPPYFEPGQFAAFIVILTIGSACFFFILVFLSMLKSKFCCKRKQ